MVGFVVFVANVVYVVAATDVVNAVCVFVSRTDMFWLLF